jgi:hypothetical protein
MKTESGLLLPISSNWGEVMAVTGNCPKEAMHPAINNRNRVMNFEAPENIRKGRMASPAASGGSDC